VRKKMSVRLCERRLRCSAGVPAIPWIALVLAPVVMTHNDS
jgi:hypothetical protein